MEDAHARDVAEVLAAFQLDAGRGLDDSAVLRSRQLHGRNEIPPEKGTPFWKLVIKQFDDLLVKILLVSAVVSVGLSIANGRRGLPLGSNPRSSCSSSWRTPSSGSSRRGTQSRR